MFEFMCKQDGYFVFKASGRSSIQLANLLEEYPGDPHIFEDGQTLFVETRNYFDYKLEKGEKYILFLKRDKKNNTIEIVSLLSTDTLVFDVKLPDVSEPSQEMREKYNLEPLKNYTILDGELYTDEDYIYGLSESEDEGFGVFLDDLPEPEERTQEEVEDDLTDSEGEEDD